MQTETRDQLKAQGWSDLKIIRAELREVERDIRHTRDSALLRSLGHRRKELKDALAALEGGVPWKE